MKTSKLINRFFILLFVGLLTVSFNACSGDDGDMGPMGPQGGQGIQGEKGEPGEDGKDGKKGDPGKDGVDGKKGDPGKDGKDGKDGKNGIDGKDGADGNANVTISDWQTVTNFEAFSGIGNTMFDGEIYGEKTWQMTDRIVTFTDDDVVMVYVKMIKSAGEKPIVKPVPFEMEIDHMVVNFRTFAYDANQLYYVLGLMDGNNVDFENFNFGNWMTDHEVQWRYVIIRGAQSKTLNLPEFKDYPSVKNHFNLND